MTSVFEFPDAALDRIDEDADAFLDSLPGPTTFRRAGRDRTRLRAVVGMLHGNEPSGYRAIHQVLRSNELPAVDVVFFVGAVEAARTEPRYTLRMLPGRRDLNRCFGEGPRPSALQRDPDFAIASRALTLLTQRPLEAALDLHNNSGQNPPYGVGLLADPLRLALTVCFAQLFVHVDWRLGTAMEALERYCPSLVIECGKAGDVRADEVALKGLRQFLQADELPERVAPGQQPRVLAHPVRVTLKPALSLAFAARPAHADFVMDADIDRHNFQTLPRGTRLGWLNNYAACPVQALDADGNDHAPEFFEQRDHTLLTRIPLIPMMMTTVPEVAKTDCLFYAVRA